MKTCSIQFAGICVCVILITSEAYAEQFYKWVDDDGVTHYGEILPNANTKHVSFEFPDNYVKSNPEEDYYSIQNQLQRMQDRRAKRREERLRRQENATVQQQTASVEYEDGGYPYYSAVAYPPIYYPHVKHRSKRGCGGGRDCYLPSRFYKDPYRRYKKSSRYPANGRKYSGRSRSYARGGHKYRAGSRHGAQRGSRSGLNVRVR